jgi:rhodanese-related sulfurtransferase
MEQFFSFLGNHPILVGTFLLLLFLFFRNERTRAGATVGTQELVRLVNKENAVVLDVRERNEFMEGHIVDALNIPYTSLESRLDEISQHKETPIVIACKMGQHSGAAGTLLQKNGFTNVTRLTGGYAEWRAQNLPVVKT